jgi:ATP-dependent protease ClpP protease subunit
MKKYNLTEPFDVSLTPPLEENVPTMSHQPPEPLRGIEVEENRIFFYCPVSHFEALELNRLIRRLDVEMQYLSSRLGCKPVPIHLHIHSPGGSIFAGLSIYDTIKNSKTAVHTYVDGSAASAATIISIAGKKRFIGKNGFMLVHQQQLEWSGKLDDFMDEIENQRELTEIMKNIYLQETKMDAEFLEELLARELWLPSERCLELGLVDTVQ